MRLLLLHAIGVLLPSLAAARAASSTTLCGNNPTPSPTPSRSFHCDAQGTYKEPQYIIASYPSLTGDDQACYQGCLGSPGCISFAYDTNNSACLLFDRTVNRLGFKRSATSGIFFSNLKGCYLPATCGPAPKQYIANGGFEDATLDANGEYQARPWDLDGLGVIQRANGYGHSQFSLALTNVSVLDAGFPEPLVVGNNYTLSFYYYIALDNTYRDAHIQYGFAFSQGYVGGLNLHRGPKRYHRHESTFTYTDNPDQTVLIFLLAGQYTGAEGKITVQLDNFSVVDAAPSLS